MLLVIWAKSWVNDNEELENLLVDFHTEVFRHTHFRMYNRQRSIDIKQSHSNEGNETIFSIRVSYDNPIIVSYSQIQEPGN